MMLYSYHLEGLAPFNGLEKPLGGLAWWRWKGGGRKDWVEGGGVDDATVGVWLE